MNREISKYPSGSPKQQNLKGWFNSMVPDHYYLKMVENHQTPIHLKTGYPAFRATRWLRIEGFQLSEVGTQSGNVAKPPAENKQIP